MSFLSVALYPFWQQSLLPSPYQTNPSVMQMYPFSWKNPLLPVLLPQHRSSLQAFQTALLQDMQNWTATLPEAVPQDPVHRSALSRTLSSSMHHLHCLPASLNHQDLSLKNQSSNSDLLDSESLNSHTSRYM